MSEFFKPYEGSHPFVFVSYAHRQSDAVVSTIRILQEVTGLQTSSIICRSVRVFSSLFPIDHWSLPIATAR